jgi:GNAT superfamily N-acetyltransferase
MTAVNDTELKRLIDLAMKDPFLGPSSLKNNMDRITPLIYEGKTVGFVVPFQEKDGYWRTGTIYIEPKYRKKGIAHQWIESFLEGKPGRAWIEPRNASSIAAYTAAGLTKSGKRTTAPGTGRVFEEYLTEEAGMESKVPNTLSW